MAKKKAFYKSTTFQGVCILAVSLVMIIFKIDYAELLNVFGMLWTLYGRVKADKPLGLKDQ